MKKLRYLPIVTGIACLLLLAGTGRASEKIAAGTGKACTSCHDKPGSRLLTDGGKYYETMRSMAGFEELHATFGRCTACHDRKPGSRRLTKKGREFAGLAKDMPGLYQWMRESHPTPAVK